MKFVSTKNENNLKSFTDAALRGVAEDGGLFIPINIPSIDVSVLRTQTFQQTAEYILSRFIDYDEIELNKIISEAFNFPVKVKELADNLFVLELFHGPSDAFKDFGARFLARVLSSYAIQHDIKITILVATSGDTGSAVGKAFYKAKNIDVYLLYPSGKISAIQEKQLTTIGGNVTALEIKGNFDDCQSLVKRAFADEELRSRINLSSANSINIARLLPQITYYFEAFKYLSKEDDAVVSVPSGNLGNISGAIIAKKMGLPINHLISALNVNDVFKEYITSGNVRFKTAVPTISNAMDVGAPNNLERISAIYVNHSSIKSDISAYSFTDEETMREISLIYKEHNYVVCPHTAVAMAAVRKYRKENNYDGNIIVASTAHPAKFMDIYPDEIKRRIDMPEQLKDAMTKEKESIVLSNEYDEFKEFLLSYHTV